MRLAASRNRWFRRSNLPLLLVGLALLVHTRGAAESVNQSDTERVKVTVSIPVYNDPEHVIGAVESVLQQTHRNLEIFVVDDHSSRPVFDLLRQRFAHLKDPRLHLIRLDRNVGLYSVKNFVLKNLATGDFVTSQDSDDVSHPERIERQVEHALRNKLDGVGLKMRRIDTDGRAVEVYNGYPSRRPPSGTQPYFDNQRYSSANVPSEDKAIYRTEYAVRLGGFAGRRRVEGDTDFAGRFARVFWTGAVNDYPLYDWMRRDGSLTTAPETGFSNRKWWLRGKRLPSARRVRARIARNASKIAANLFFRLGATAPFIKTLVQDLYYPRDLHIELYEGLGLPRGRFVHLDPLSPENVSWWRTYLRARTDWKPPVVRPRSQKAQVTPDCPAALSSLSGILKAAEMSSR